MDIDNRIKRLAEADKAHIWHPFTQMKDWAQTDPVIITGARDCFLKDINGRWYLDGVSSMWVNIFGHRKKEIDEAIAAQLGRVAHSTLLGLAGEPSIELAEKLAALMEESFGPFAKSGGRRLTRIFYSDDGSTAVEVALKMAFQYWQHRGVKEKTRFISLENGYHGDTLGAVSVGGVGIFHEAFAPLLFKTHKAPSPYCYRCGLGRTFPGCTLACAGVVEEILKAHAGEVAGLILEPLVQAAGGMIVFPKGYVAKIRELCDRYGVLMIADEVATGFGRTGRMFACQHEEVAPDIICLSKGITGGYLPLAVTIATEEIYGAFLGGYAELKTFFHGHSYTGNALACAAALATLGLFEKEKAFFEQMRAKTELLGGWLRDMSGQAQVGEARGIGLMAGVEMVMDKKTKEPFPWHRRMGWEVALRALEKGLFIRPLGNVIVIMPPLSISMDNLKAMLGIIRESMDEAFRAPGPV